MGALDIGMQSALHADFGGAALAGDFGAMRHFIQTDELGIVVFTLAREAAEAASHITNVGEIDIARDDKADLVADTLMAHEIGGRQQGHQIRSGSTEQYFAVGAADFLSGQMAFENPPDHRRGLQQGLRQTVASRGILETGDQFAIRGIHAVHSSLMTVAARYCCAARPSARACACNAAWGAGSRNSGAFR